MSSLTVRFSTVTALTDVNLTVRAGEVVALAGENGAGKTTLIRSVAGDLAPASGVDPGRRAGGRPGSRRRRQAGGQDRLAGSRR